MGAIREGGREGEKDKKLFKQKLIKTDLHRGGGALLDKTDDPDDPDPGRQAGAFLATNSWKRLLQLRLPGQVRAVSGLGQERSGLASGVKNVSLELLHFSSSTECWTPNDFFLFLLFLSFLFLFPPSSLSLFLSLSSSFWEIVNVF